MNHAELNQHDGAFRAHLSNFRQTSFSSATSRFALDESPEANAEAVNFDDVIRDWYRTRVEREQNIPCSVDAVCFVNGKLFAIEFKSGGVDTLQLSRKIYDTVLALIEKDRRDIFYCRNNVIYTVVYPKSDMDNQMKTAMRALDYGNNFDECHGNASWGLKAIEGLVVSKVYGIPDNMFRRFAKKKCLC